MAKKRAKDRQTTYYRAVHYLGNNYILCNNICEVEENIYDNMRFSLYDEEDNLVEIYQWYLTDASESDIKWLEKSFGLLFAYSEKLDLYVLCVDHCGTCWHGVYVDVKNDDISDENLVDKEAF